MSWFKRKGSSERISSKIQKVELKPIDYPSKIILVWAKAIEGNDEMIHWLRTNGYPELAMATFAIYLKKEARDWLITNGYAHIMAMINACEGNEKAQKWLKLNHFRLLKTKKYLGLFSQVPKKSRICWTVLRNG